jgi:hypothetical protein
MEKLQTESALRLRPQRMFVAKPDRLVLVVRQLAQKLRRKFLRRTVGRARKRTRPPFQRRVVESGSTKSQIGAR